LAALTPNFIFQPGILFLSFPFLSFPFLSFPFLSVSLFPLCSLRVYSSHYPFASLPKSDIDMVVIFDWPRDILPPLHRLASEIEKADLAESMKVLDKARVPIIKLKDSLVGFDIDIRFSFLLFLLFVFPVF